MLMNVPMENAFPLESGSGFSICDVLST